MKTYITSDLHFNHKNICGPNAFEKKRTQFANVHEMNEYLVSIHNRTVGANDEVIMLGDFALHGKPVEIFELYNKMNGSFVIVKGNHDGTKTLNYLKANNYKLPNGRDKFEIHEVGFIRKKEGVVYHFTHYPLEIGHFRNGLRSICGHIHGRYAPSPNMLNVGIDSPELPKDTVFGAPILLEDAMRLVNEKLAKAVELQENKVEVTAPVRKTFIEKLKALIGK